MFQFESQGAVEVLSPETALNHENIDKLTAAFEGKSFSGQPMVVLDMSRVALVDSAVLEALLDIQKQLRESAGSLKLSGLTQLVEDVFRITGLAERFETYPNIKAAVGSFVK